MKPLILIGMMGSGKSTVGKCLAERVNYKFLDMDETIENIQGLKIKDIFELKGESYFRQQEEELLFKLSDKTHMVISTGGGIVINPINTLRMKEMGIVVFLKGSEPELKKRLAGETENRPMLKQMAIESILKVRSPLYEQTAQLIVDIDGKSVDEIVQEIILKLEINELHS